MTNLARCCKPAPPTGCRVRHARQGRNDPPAELQQYRAHADPRAGAPDRRRWGAPRDEVFPVDVVLEAMDRHGSAARHHRDLFARADQRHRGEHADAQQRDANGVYAEVRSLGALGRALRWSADVRGVLSARPALERDLAADTRGRSLSTTAKRGSHARDSAARHSVPADRPKRERAQGLDVRDAATRALQPVIVSDVCRERARPFQTRHWRIPCKAMRYRPGKEYRPDAPCHAGMTPKRSQSAPRRSCFCGVRHVVVSALGLALVRRVKEFEPDVSSSTPHSPSRDVLEHDRS